MLNNKSGEAIIGLFVIVAIIGVGLVTTARNGVLKTNGKKILCKMQNQGDSFCENKYRVKVHY